MRTAVLFALISAARMAANVEAPILFEQRGEGVFQVRGNGYAVRVDGAGMVLGTRTGATELRWTGNRDAKARGEGRQAAIYSYQGPARAAYTAFSGLRVSGIFAGVDLVYYGSERRMEYDFVVGPGADPSAIRFRVSGEIAADGSLALPNGLVWKRPVAKQGVRSIDARFVSLGGGEYGFAVGAYDRSRELVIDPVLTYATYLGGSLADEVRGIAVDPQGNVYVAGSTLSVDFPGTTSGRTFGSQDVFVAKINPSGRGLVYGVYIGGSSVDTGVAIAVDATGAAYVTGQTASNNFPVSANAPQKSLLGGNAITDAFVLKLAPNGSQIVYSTYLGGAASDVGNSIALDTAGAVYVAGRTDSTDFPSTSRETLPARGGGDAFVTKLAADGGSLVYSTLLGGFGIDVGAAVAVDAAGAAYVTGETRSENFPVTDAAYQKTRRGASDAFVTKLLPNGSGLTYSTFYGGTGSEFARGIGVDGRGNAYIAGQTISSDLPVTSNAAQPVPALTPDAFVARLDPQGSSLVYGTYLGGDGEDQAYALAVDSIGNAYIAGATSSPNFPMRNDGSLAAFEPRGGVDGFLTRVTAGGNLLQFSTYFGGSGDDTVHAIAIDGAGRTWLAGVTNSPSLPGVSGSLASAPLGAADGFVALMSEISVSLTPVSATLGPRETQQFTATVSNSGNTAVRWSIFPDIGTITSTGLYTAPQSFTGSPVVTVSAISQADGTKVAQAAVTLVNRLTITMTPRAASLGPQQTQQFTAVVSGGPDTRVVWTLTPNVGSITSTGLYTAPATLLVGSTVTVRAAAAADNTKFVEGFITLVAPLSPPPPVVPAGGITNAASFRAVGVEGGIAPGQMLTIFGQNMASSTASLQLDGRGFVATRLAGTRVLFDGTPGAMILAATQQVSAVVPYDVEGKREVIVQVEFEGRVSTGVAIPVLASAPGIFTQSSTGAGAGAVTRASGAFVTSAEPAIAGEILILFATGEGATDPAGVDGRPAAVPLPRPKLPVRVVIDGREIVPAYAGGAPGQVAGVMQVNFVVPEGLAGGDRRLQLRVGDKLSSEAVTLPVR
ncbi:MAG: hypothetical protein FJW30_07935 [Acidobacteria bacterium]|nr:hypothetical protein [Acidobacteriota bacterium]